jgi:hypothetical protein
MRLELLTIDSLAGLPDNGARRDAALAVKENVVGGNEGCPERLYRPTLTKRKTRRK